MNAEPLILLVTYGIPGNKAVAENINKIVKILKNFSPNIYLITFADVEYISELDNDHICHIKSREDGILQFFHIQLATSKTIFQLSRNVHFDIILFALGMDLQIFPVITAKLVGKRVLLRSDGRPTFWMSKISYLKSPKKLIFGCIENINYQLPDSILSECEYMISRNKFPNKRCEVANLFVDDIFRMKKSLDMRKYDIGYVGRLSKDKGIIDFLTSLEELKNNYKIVIHGHGEEKDSVKNKIEMLRINRRLEIQFSEWIERENLPDLLNEIKLLVVPSQWEGLPNIILEAMACGTPVLANPVGGIPGIIDEGITGFFIENAKPDDIARDIERCLANPKLDIIGYNARQYIITEFGYNITIERWRKIINSDSLS
jgi:glycosyltransferase involved in cell wall biosynthesis